MLSTPGIHSQLRIHRETKKKDIERFGRWLLDVTVDPEHAPVGIGLRRVPDIDLVVQESPMTFMQVCGISQGVGDVKVQSTIWGRFRSF